MTNIQIFHFNLKDWIAFGSYNTSPKPGNLKHMRGTERIASSQCKLVTNIAVPASNTHFHTSGHSVSISNNLN